MYQQRHNRIVDLIFDKIRSLSQYEHIKLFKDCILKPSMVDSDNEQFTHAHTRPDIFAIDNVLKHVTIIEISIPFDAHLDRCYNENLINITLCPGKWMRWDID